MQLVTYNLLCQAYMRKEYYPHSKPEDLAAEARLERVLTRVTELGADLLCLQEVDANTAHLLQKALPDFSACYLSKGRGKPDGCLTLSRYPVHSWHRWEYADGSGHVALAAEVESPLGRLCLANTHLKWGELGPGQLSELLVRLEPLREQRVVVCGDLNLLPGDPALQLPKQGLGLGELHPDLPSAVVNGRAVKLDYIFASRELNGDPIDPPALHDQLIFPNDEEPSDHVPVRVRLR